MKRVRLIHWKADEAAERARALRQAGYHVAHGPVDPAGLQQLRDNPPAAVIIDLSRRPSLGRDIALALRHYKGTRRVPLVLANGDPDKLKRIKSLLPDATYTTWNRIRSSLKRAIANPPVDPVVPASSMAGYSGTPLVKKLGIKPQSQVALVGASPNFERTLGVLPEGTKLRRQARGRCDMIIWFAKSRSDLQKRVAGFGELAGSGGLWIAWPKKTSGAATDLSANLVRKAGLAAGLVDYKICAIDETWSGLRFARRKIK